MKMASLVELNNYVIFDVKNIIKHEEDGPKIELHPHFWQHKFFAFDKSFLEGLKDYKNHIALEGV